MGEEGCPLAAIMFTDMVGYSSRAQVDEAAALALLDRRNPAFLSGRPGSTVAYRMSKVG